MRKIACFSDCYDGENKSIKIWNIENGKCKVIKSGIAVFNKIIKMNNWQIVSCNSDGKVEIWDTFI